MSRLPNTTATWARPNDRHWCNVCKIFVDGNPSKIRQHESAGRHNNNLRQQLKALKRREVDQRRDRFDKEAEIRSIDHNALTKLVQDSQRGFVSTSAFGQGYHEVASKQVPKRKPSSNFSEYRPSDYHQTPQYPDRYEAGADTDLDIIAAVPAVVNLGPLDEDTGMGQWQSVPVEETSLHAELNQPLEEEAQSPVNKPLPTYVDVDQFTDLEQIAEAANDYGLPALRTQDPHNESKSQCKPFQSKSISGMERPPVVFKKRRKPPQ
uniref:Matrin-type domain-containing protein n=1 Tax=Spongospora subterranea TaxID=70186 RepID=A0A0H5R4D3_9EUKA|eukprot:CRZ02894.1 hypothetical protein [Spongospora subterranea]